MNRIILLLMALASFAGLVSRAQDAAVEERLLKLDGLVQDLLEDKTHQKKQIENLAKEIEALRELQNHAATACATAEALQQLAGKVQEIDRKREADRELILRKIEELARSLAVPAGPPKRSLGASRPAAADSAGPPAIPETGFEHVVQSGETLSAIAQAYHEKGIKVAVKQILKANPGLVPERMPVGQRIFIPAPKP